MATNVIPLRTHAAPSVTTRYRGERHGDADLVYCVDQYDNPLGDLPRDFLFARNGEGFDWGPVSHAGALDLARGLLQDATGDTVSTAEARAFECGVIVRLPCTWELEARDVMAWHTRYCTARAS